MKIVEEYIERSMNQIDSLGKEVFSKEELKKIINNILTSLNYQLK